MEVDKKIQEHIINQPYNNSIEYVVTGDRGTFNSFFRAVSGVDWAKNNIGFNIQPFELNINWSFELGSDLDVMKIIVSDDFRQGSPKHQRLFKDIYEYKSHKLTPNQYLNRGRYLAALTIVGIIPDTNLIISDDSVKNDNTIMTARHELMNNVIKMYVKPEGNFEEQFNQAMRVLWYRYPGELTGYDNFIRQVTLENESL